MSCFTKQREEEEEGRGRSVYTLTQEGVEAHERHSVEEQTQLSITLAKQPYTSVLRTRSATVYRPSNTEQLPPTHTHSSAVVQACRTHVSLKGTKETCSAL